ncbi:MAG TPA: glycosyltransferase [Dehalococcoidia bacterium]|nr:glycosyltransferase [Dehalococcoidia bacterium]
MRVVYLADAPYPHTRRWVEHFRNAGAECEVISFRPFDIEGVKVHYVDGAEPLGKARYLIHARRVKQLIHDLRPDILHALHLTSYGFLGALSTFRPFLLSVWGTDILEAPRLTPFHRWLTRYALSRADRITATGLHLATETTRYTPAGRSVTVVPYGVDLQQFKPRRRPASERVIIGTASRLSPEKGIRYLVEAFAILRQRFGDRVELRIAGDGPERPKLEAQIQRLGLEGRVEMRGWIEHQALPEFLAGLDVFVLPSTWEGFGVAAAEASAVELPVVASNVFGIPDVVRDGLTGLLVAPKDAGAIARAVGRLVEDAELRRSLGKAGREYVARHYDWRENARQMAAIYASLLPAESASAAS